MSLPEIVTATAVVVALVISYDLGRGDHGRALSAVNALVQWLLCAMHASNGNWIGVGVSVPFVAASTWLTWRWRARRGPPERRT